MKLSTNTDFTKLPRAGEIAAASGAAIAPIGTITLPHDERHLRRRVLTVSTGEKILVDLPEAISLGHGDRLLLDDGRQVEIAAETEPLYEIRPRDPVHLAEIAWHIGNRHLAAAIEPKRILILRDHVIKAMLEGLGASVAEIAEPFVPLRGAYSGHGGHGHDHDEHDRPAHDGHEHDGHAHEQGGKDRFGRMPGDPHYGHGHA